MAEGIRNVLPNARVLLRPLSDGGEGLIDVLSPTMGAEIRTQSVAGPVPGMQVKARWGYAAHSRTAIIEMAEASGLGLVPALQRNPLITTTFGVGQLIRCALDQGAKTLLVGIGGSATNDGGSGMAKALGVHFRDVQGTVLPPGGAALLHLASIDTKDLDPRLKETTVIVACDVRNPLTGPDGASAVFGPQKGASPEEVAFLDNALVQYSNVIQETFHVDVQSIAGSGAAGGLGAGLMVFCNARLQSGIDLVLDQTGFDGLLDGIDLVLTGEGRIDEQTMGGKVLSGVLARARKRNVPVAAIVGSVKGRAAAFVGPESLVAVEPLLNASIKLQDAMKHAHVLLRSKTESVIPQLIATLSKH
jgi:glycerate 2-kinase